MNLSVRFLLKIMRQNLPILLSGSLSGMLLLLLISFQITPQYTSSVQLFVSTPASALDISSLNLSSTFSQQRVKSYADIINSPITLNPVIEKLNLKTTAQELASQVSAIAPENTVLISVSVSSPNPILAANIANAVGSQFEITASQLEFGDSGSGIKVTVVRDAIPSRAPSSPRYTLNLLVGTLLGFLAGLGVCLVRSFFSATVKNVDHLQGVDLLAAIGFDAQATEFPLISSINKYSARTEAFRQLRTNVIHKSENSKTRASNTGGHAIVFTSCLPGEGKTTSCLNLGLSLASSGHKVLVIEADLRRPTTSKYFLKKEIVRGTGLSELLLRKTVTEANFAKFFKTSEIPGISVLTSGAIPPNAGELLVSEKMTKLLRYARKKFDFVLIDTPPLLPVSDALPLIKLSDGAIVVVHAGKARLTQFSGVMTRIDAVDGNVLGVVLNKIPEDARDYDDYGYRYEYSKYGYRGYLARRYYAKYGNSLDSDAYRPYFGEESHTYPPRPEDLLRLKIDGKND